MLLAFAHLAHAQAATTSLSGSVQSDENKPLPGAAVTVIHVPSGVRHAAASDGSGRFVIPNLPVGGPYVMQVGEGGYRPQTMESIFLENGKTAPFTVTLSKLDAAASNNPGKSRSARATKTTSTEGLAAESVVGGPILFATTTSTSGRMSPAARSATPARSVPAARFQPVPQIIPAPAPAPPPPASVLAPAPAAPYRYARNNRYPPRRTSPPAPDPIVPGRYDAKTGNYLYDTGQPTTLKLPGGAVIAGVGTNSTESYLHRFLDNAAVQVDTVDLTRGWFNFDRVFFNAGKATLTAESVSQLRNVAALLRAYPRARVKLGGYTDSTGTYKVNKLLSDARARTAWASLVEMGISPSRVDAHGYGPRYSIAPNTSEEGRAQNRRLSVKVLQK
ncbi:hypothetical protein GCM10022407_01620 [Hymenobacter antarcticus]|uniref:OmpA-like domain-containing protein n=1 Tax=Hymenobacter antarcticus TaxID=486270 RepID=A0ABP7P109_9BACT